MPEDNQLEDYRARRHFEVTPEPAGELEPEATDGSLFVVQKHDATRLHYDFRLEVGGVLKSWAIPKGPSTNPKDKRLAAPTEDHPMSYARFEGRIPKGQYGAGPVIVWDIGTYRNITESGGNAIPMEQALDSGRADICLNGNKLQGGYALVRFKTGADEAWLLIKMRDQYAEADQDITKAHPESALTGRTIEKVD